MISLRTHAICLLLTLPGIASAVVTPQSLQNRLSELAPLGAKGLDLDALKREVGYENQQLSTKQRARLEADLLLKQIRFGVQAAYQAALKATGNAEAARAKVRENALQDLEHIDPALADDVRLVVDDALSGGFQQAPPSVTLTKQLADASLLRQEVLQGSALTPVVLKEKVPNPSAIEDIHLGPKTTQLPRDTGGALATDNLGVLRYNSRQEMAQAMVSATDSSERWVATANVNFRSNRMTGYEENISLQMKAEFLGFEVSAGPVFKFRRTLTSTANFSGEGMNPLVDGRGFFDFVVRDSLNNVRPNRRFIFFTCELESDIEFEERVGGGFKVGGPGADIQQINGFRQSVNMSSRRILVPDAIGGYQTNLAMLEQTCHNEFVMARLSNGRTVKQNMDASIANVIAGTIYVNNAMECVKDSHCDGWYKKHLSFLSDESTTTAECVQTTNKAVMVCAKRGIQGASCPVKGEIQYGIGGMMECAKGYTCIPDKKPVNMRGWSYTKGTCIKYRTGGRF